jgi:Yip1-like protein
MMDETFPALNPWTSIWTRPRETIRWLVANRLESQIIGLAMLAGIAQALDRASTKNLGDQFGLPAIVAFCLIFGVLGGGLSLYLSGFLIHFSGRWLGGHGSLPEIRTAIAWSSVPKIAALLMIIVQIALLGQENFTSKTPSIDGNAPMIAALLAISVVEVILGIWSLVLLFKCVGEVQGFSAWKGIGNVLLAGLLILGPMLLIALAFYAMK